MKNETSNRVNMINACITFCEAESAATASITNFIAVLGEVKSKMLLVNSLSQIASGTTRGVTLDTNALRAAMTTLALKCGNGTLAYANAVGNNTLAALVNLNQSKLSRAKKEVVDDLCEGIHDAATPYVPQIAGYGVSSADLSDLAAAIGLYRTASQNPRQAIITKSQAIRQMDGMVKEVIDDLLVGQLDKMANTLKPTNLNFWNGYRQAREIIDLGRTTAKVRGTVKDVNDVPLVGVQFAILEAGTDVSVTKVETDVKGKFNASKLPAGMVDFRWDKVGYATVFEPNVKISAGKELKRKVVMVMV